MSLSDSLAQISLREELEVARIYQRLELVFPGRSGVEVADSADAYRVRLRFPLELGTGNGADRK